MDQDIDASKDDNAEVLVLSAQICGALQCSGKAAAAAALRGSSSYGRVAEKCGPKYESTRDRSDHDAV